MDEQRQWHRWFGMCWVDLFTGLPVTVEMEKDLSIKQQLLDIVIIRKGSDPLPRALPDGFTDLAAHNLISFKSFQEPLDGFALCELVGHHVNYRKQISPDFDHLLPEDHFRLFAVSVRYPQALSGHCALREVRPGVYDIEYFGPTIRLIVVHRLPQAEHNAMLHLFSYQEDLVRYGGEHYRPQSKETSTFLNKLFAKYKEEGFNMPFTYEQGVQEALAEILRDMPADKLRQLIPPEKLLEGMSVEKRLEGVSVEKRLEGVPLEKILERVPVEERAKDLPVEELSPEAWEELLRRRATRKTPDSP